MAIKFQTVKSEEAHANPRFLVNELRYNQTIILPLWMKTEGKENSTARG